MEEQEDSLDAIFNYKKFKEYQGIESASKTANPNQLVGIEIELEKIKSKFGNSPSSWNVTEDHSLKVDGMEYVSLPMKLKYVAIELKRLFEGLEAEPSVRCSVHIHLNVRDFTQEELLKFLILYCIFEKSLFNLSGNRWNSNFCVPIYDAPFLVAHFLKDWSWYKYTALNLCPIIGTDGSKKYGTVEFRHMEGTIDADRILNWINIISCLVSAAKKISKTDIQLHLNTMNTTSAYWWLAETVFGDWSKYITKQTTFKEDIESCISRTKYMFLNEKG